MCRIRDCGFLRQQKQQKNGKPQYPRGKPWYCGSANLHHNLYFKL